VKAITQGPKFHWFSFYDLHQFDPTNRYALGMEVDFEGRSPKPEDTIKIGIIDLKNDYEWAEIGTTTAWSWQLGCRLQWLPGSSDEVLWNERKDNHYVCRIYNVKTGESRMLPRPVYSVSPDGQKAYTYDFERVGFRGYGYDGIEAAYKDKAAPEETGVYLMDMNTGESELIISLARISALREPDPYPAEKYGILYFVQGEWNPSGERFMVFSRRSREKRNWRGTLGTIVFTSDDKGEDIMRVDRDLSHYLWRDDTSMLFWVKDGYYVYKDDGMASRTLLFNAPNGHQTYLPGNEWLITDTYPDKKTTIKQLYLFHIPTKSFVPLARLKTPEPYPRSTEFRNDLHPRISRDGRKIIVDSVHGGQGRQMYILDIGNILDNPPS
jgi:hypothetical protein